MLIFKKINIHVYIVTSEIEYCNHIDITLYRMVPLSVFPTWPSQKDDLLYILHLTRANAPRYSRKV